MSRRIPLRALGAPLLALALLVSFTLPAGAAPATEAVADPVLAIASAVVGTDSPAAVGEPGHRFGFSQASVLAQATNLNITKNDSPDPVAAGSNLTYSIVVSNPSTTTAVANVTVADTLPSGLTLAQVPTISGGTGGTCSGSVGSTTVSCSLTSLAAGATATVTIVALVPSTTANGTIITNTATASNPGAATVTATQTTTVTSSVTGTLTITKTGSPATVNIGDTLTYTITVTNPSSSSVSNVVVTDTLPANVNFVSATSSLGTCTGATGTTVVTCNVGTLSAGQSATITILVIATPTACTGFTGIPGFGQNFGGTNSVTLTNTASVTGTNAQGTAIASTTSNSVSTTLNCTPPFPSFPSFPGLPLLPPPPLEFFPPPPPPLLPPPPPGPLGVGGITPAFPEVPVIPEADTVVLLAGGLAVLGIAAGARAFRRRKR